MKDFPHIVIATPGRLADHLNQADDDLWDAFSNIKYLVIDEADRIINDSCFEKELLTILSFVPKKWITYLFSATLTQEA